MMLSFQQILLFCVSSVYIVRGQDPKVRITHTEPETIIENKRENVNARRNQDVSLSCFVEDLPPDLEQEVRWRKIYEVNGDTKVIFISTNMAITDNTKYSIEKPTDYTWRLRIKDIQIIDEGQYQCYVQLTGLSIVQKSRYVNVLVAPYLTPSMVSPDTTVIEGEVLDLMCNATGRPIPTIEWTRLGGAMLPNGKEIHLGEMLRIPTVKAEHRGQYRCHVWNSIGEIKRVIELDVRFAPVINLEKEDIQQAPGYSAELQCLVEANPPPGESEMKWVKDGLSYTVSSEKYMVRKLVGAFDRITYELIIDGVDEEDYGTYSCQVSNSMSTTGPTIKRVSLSKSIEPVDSLKLGRPVKAGEWRERFRDYSRGSSVMFSMTTLLMCFVAIIIHH